MFESAEDEYHHTEEQRQILAQFMRVLPEAVYGAEDQDVAEDREDEDAQKIIRKLGLAQSRSFLPQDRRDPGLQQDLRGQKRSGQIAEPDERQIQRIGFVVFKQIADSAGVERQASCADTEQTDGERERTDDLAVDRKKYRAAQ